MKTWKDPGDRRKQNNAAKATISIGTSGWQYKHWRGTFYPKGLKTAEEFNFYLSFFDTVELNNSFYKLPGTGTFTTWRKATPDGFQFAVKASRFITHMKKLKMTREEISRFFLHVGKLNSKLGPILFQLPPRWKANPQRLDDFCKILPRKLRFAFEFRNSSWYDGEVYRVLTRYNAAFCIYHLEGHLSPLVETADFIYVRLHGPGNKYQGSYNSKDLTGWAEKCINWRRAGKDVYVYFDNDEAGYAAHNAISLKALVEQGEYNLS